MSATDQARGLVVVAVNFDAQTEGLLKTATSLSQQFGADLHFVHVVEPIALQLRLTAISPYGSYFPIDTELEGELIQQQEVKLSELLARVRPPVRATGCVLSGMVAQTLIAESLAKKANLLLTAFSPESYQLSATGLSTALTLMHEAPLPVLAVNAGSTLDFTKAGFRLLVADDLQDTTSEAVRKAYELASGLTQGHLRHVNVHTDLRDLLRASWSQMRQSFAGADRQNLTPDSLWTAEYQARVDKAHHQAAPFEQRAKEAKVVVEIDIRASARVADELYKVAADAQPDLVVFGRHRLFKARPFLIGRMPLRTMLQMHKSVLIVPPAAELFARLPFPAARP